MLKLSVPITTNQEKYAIAAANPAALAKLEQASSPSESGCVEWHRAKTASGYGVLTISKQLVYAHRLAYWLAHGPVEPGMVIDHICHTRACVNTDHLRVLTNEQNASEQARTRKTHCVEGHALTGSNLRVHIDSKARPHRHCVTCNKQRSLEHRS